MVKTKLVNNTKSELMVIAKKLNISGRWDMTKDELTIAITKADESYIDKSSDKMKYIEEAAIGSIVAFKIDESKAKSAKIVQKSSKKRKLKLETEYGATFIVPYESVVWVKTGNRWPRGVYEMLKGSSNEKEEVKENC